MSAESPAVSVVLPFRNAASTLGEALASIAAQSRTDFECILVDHASEDSSRDIAEAMARSDPRFRVIGCDGSFVDALDRGVSTARAPLIARMDADDRSHPSRFAMQLELMQTNADIGMTSCLVECFPRANLGPGMRRYQHWINSLVTDQQIRNAIFVESPLPHPSVVFRRSLYAKAGGYRETDGPEDYDLWLRMILGGARVEKVPAVLLEWRESDRRTSRVDPRYGKDRFFATKVRHFPKAVGTDTPLQIWGTGPTARRWARQLLSLGYEIRRFADVIEKRVGRTVQGIPVESPAAIDPDHGFVLAAVGLLGARALIEAELTGRGMVAGRDYLAVA